MMTHESATREGSSAWPLGWSADSRRRLLTRRELIQAGAISGGLWPAVTWATCDGWIRVCGLRLQYRQYGLPDGFPVFYFHGMPGSRLEPGLIEHEAFASGVRLIALNRPGIGCSTREDVSVCQWPRLIVGAANALHISRFSIVGVSGGTPFALACALKIPHRIHRVAIVSGHAPFKRGLTKGNQDTLVRIVGACQGLGGVALTLIKNNLRKKPAKAMQSLAKAWTDADRRLVLCDPVNREKFRQNLTEAFCQPHGLADDIQKLAKPWGFRLCQIRCVPVAFWHGACDELVPPDHARFMHGEIRGSSLFINPCSSHVTTLKIHAADVLHFVQAPG